MKPTVHEAARLLEERGLLTRTRADQSAGIIDHVREALGNDLPEDLEAFYRERISRVGDFNAILPTGNDRVGWRSGAVRMDSLLPASAVPLFSDGCGSLFGLDLSAADAAPAVYFFDHEDEFRTPRWAAGSSLGSFLLLLADSDQAQSENWPLHWELKLDPDLDKCTRAPAIWNTG
jgi:hypothetical protein